MQNWWQLNERELSERLQTHTENGLSDSEAKLRLEQYGPNQLREKKGRHPAFLFLDQFKDFIIWVLIAAALVSGFLREWVDALAIVVIVILNAVLGFIQEYRAEKSLAALKRLSSPSSKVIRDGKRRMVPSIELVPGDAVEIEAGDHVPADCRVVWCSANFAVQEASLTGESTPVEKTPAPIAADEVPLAAGLDSTVHSHVIAFAGEEARVTGRTVDLAEFERRSGAGA